MRRLLLVLLPIFIWGEWNLYPSYKSYLKKNQMTLKPFFFRANTSLKIVALTFDDGPNRATSKIMKVLKRYNTPATFFLISKNLNKNNVFLN